MVAKSVNSRCQQGHTHSGGTRIESVTASGGFLPILVFPLFVTPLFHFLSLSSHHPPPFCLIRLLVMSSDSYDFSIFGNSRVLSWYILHDSFLKMVYIIVLTCISSPLPSGSKLQGSSMCFIFKSPLSLPSVWDLCQAQWLIYLTHIYWVPAIFQILL